MLFHSLIIYHPNVIYRNIIKGDKSKIFIIVQIVDTTSFGKKNEFINKCIKYSLIFVNVLQ